MTPTRSSGAARDAAGAEGDLAAQSRNGTSEQADTAAESRDRAADLRDADGTDRDTSATERDKTAGRRDHLADRRDRSAELRDFEAGGRDEWVAEPGALGHTLPEDGRPTSPDWFEEYRRQLAAARGAAASDREHASGDRAAAAGERECARVDRVAAGRDRESGSAQRFLSHDDRRSASDDRNSAASGRTHADNDRADALADRGSAARDRHHASLDELTGAYTRGAGFVELNREIARSRRIAESLVVAFVDVDHLKHINDTDGHGAGDHALIRVAEALRATLRSYDLVVRYGGDEFFAVLTGLDLATANERFKQVALKLAATSPAVSISLGLAELRSGDTATLLVARADDAMYRSRGRRVIPGDRASGLL
ncbi:MAG: diguanylate cyclase [Nakamurella sp.]